MLPFQKADLRISKESIHNNCKQRESLESFKLT